MTLSEAVHTFDGTHVAELRAAAASFSDDDATLLVELCESNVPSHRVAATWILKALCEGGRFQPMNMTRCFNTLDTAPWEAALHLLQSVQYAPDAAASQRNQIKLLLQDSKTLVRVWALDALVRVALVSDEGTSEAQRQVRAAFDDEKASVRARARKLATLLDL